MPNIVITPSTAQLVTLQQIKHQCRIDDDDTSEDDLLEHVYLPAAVQHIESAINRPVLRQTLQYRGVFSAEVELSAGLFAVEQVSYIDTNGADKTLAEDRYYVDGAAEVGRVVPVSAWPSVKAGHPAPVTIRYTAGWSDPEAVPAPIKQAALMLIGHWVMNKESVVIGTITAVMPMATSMLLAPYRVNVL